MKHVRWACTLGYEKCDQCNYDSHPDLFLCAVCGLTEGELTTDCPGQKADDATHDYCYAGKLDYVDGKGWITK